jgi:hypothetical protein
MRALTAIALCLFALPAIGQPGNADELRKPATVTLDPNGAAVHLKNVLIPFAKEPTKEDLPRLLEEGQKVGASLPNCAAVDDKGKCDGLSGDPGPPGQMTKISALPRGIASLVADLQVDQMSRPVPTNDGIMLFMVCARDG